MVVGMLYFMAMIVKHFTDADDYVKAQEAAKKDSLLNAQIQQLIDNQVQTNDSLRSHQIKIDALQFKVSTVNYKINALGKFSSQ
jgi:hypothetical protein